VVQLVLRVLRESLESEVLRVSVVPLVLKGLRENVALKVSEAQLVRRDLRVSVVQPDLRVLRESVESEVPRENVALKVSKALQGLEANVVREAAMVRTARS
jgi:hypothetical protein